MRKHYFVLIVVLFVVLISNAQNNDSLNKKEHKFMLGITIAPNYSWRKYYEKYGPASYGKPGDEKPGMGYSVLINEKITLKRFLFNAGAGISFYNYNGVLHNPYPYSYAMFNYQYRHVLISIPIGYNILLGKNKLWYTGLTIDLNYILKLTQGFQYHSSSKYTQTYDFTNRMFVIWGGLEIGRTIKVAKSLNIDISINCKYSTKINTNYISDYPVSIFSPSRNLMTTSINISFYPIFKKR